MPDVSTNLFHVEVMQGIHLISSSRGGPTEDGRSLAAGQATANSYLVVGEERALLLDLAVDEPGVKEFCGFLAGKPVQLALSHGHPDHVFHLDDFDEVSMHPADETLIRNGLPGMPSPNPGIRIRPLLGGDSIDLGDRIIDVLHVPGHTDGSLLLLDRRRRVLLSGDTCARRLLYGTMGAIPTDRFCESLRLLKELEFDVLYSAHDRCALPKAHLDLMMRVILDELPRSREIWRHPAFEEMVRVTFGDEGTLRYFDMVAPARCIHEGRQ